MVDRLGTNVSYCWFVVITVVSKRTICKQEVHPRLESLQYGGGGDGEVTFEQNCLDYRCELQV